MIPAAIAHAIRCWPRLRRVHRVASASPPRLTMQQAAALLAPRPRIVRRVAGIALGCTAATLPTIAVAPAAPPEITPPTVSAPLPFGIGSGPVLSPMLPSLVAAVPGSLAGAPGGWPISVPAERPAEQPIPEPPALLLIGGALVALTLASRRPLA